MVNVLKEFFWGLQPKRVMVFVDGSNLYKSEAQIRKNSNSDFSIDMKKFLKFLSEGNDLKRAYYYNSLPDKADGRTVTMKKMNEQGILEDAVVPIIEGELKRYESLRFNGYTVRFNYLKYNNEVDGTGKVIGRTPFQKGVDTMLACDVISHAHNDAYDIAIIVAGDDDFVPLIETVKAVGKNIGVVQFRKPIGRNLAQHADFVVYLDNYMGEINYIKKAKPTSPANSTLTDKPQKK